jgi:c-di-GMP-binding flagellar brake protein YcgR
MLKDQSNLGPLLVRVYNLPQRCRVADQRSSVRFPLKLPITVRTADAREYFAETADISAGGVLFYTRAILDVGTVIRFRIVLPAAVLGTDTDVMVNCTGRVVRSLAETEKAAVAAVIDEYCFERVYSAAV